VIQALRQVVEGAKKHRVPVSVCGEMAGDPVAALVLLGLGVQSLSMSASSLLRIKWVVRSFSRRRAKALLGKVVAMEDAREIRGYLAQALERKGLGGLIRAGK
jgi:phosphotransferase system enzyme I (PtsP)